MDIFPELEPTLKTVFIETLESLKFSENDAEDILSGINKIDEESINIELSEVFDIARVNNSIEGSWKGKSSPTLYYHSRETGAHYYESVISAYDLKESQFYGHYKFGTENDPLYMPKGLLIQYLHKFSKEFALIAELNSDDSKQDLFLTNNKMRVLAASAIIYTPMKLESATGINGVDKFKAIDSGNRNIGNILQQFYSNLPKLKTEAENVETTRSMYATFLSIPGPVFNWNPVPYPFTLREFTTPTHKFISNTRSMQRGTFERESTMRYYRNHFLETLSVK
jgi:hypothetical protein